jgi:hypothetical protein
VKGGSNSKVLGFCSHEKFEMNAWNSAARHDGYLITPIGQQARQNEFVTFWEQETTGS